MLGRKDIEMKIVFIKKYLQSKLYGEVIVEYIPEWLQYKFIIKHRKFLYNHVIDYEILMNCVAEDIALLILRDYQKEILKYYFV